MSRTILRSGFTMVELLVAVGILSIVVAGVMESFVVSNRAYTVVDQTTETQQSSRAIASLLERDLQMTGFMVPEGGSACAIDETNQPDTLYLSDADAIDPDGQASANLGADINGAPSIGTPTSGFISVVLNMAEMSLDGLPFYDNNADFVPDADFRIGGGVIVMNPANVALGTACGIVREISGTTLRVDFETGLGGGGGGGGLVAIPAHRYAVTEDVDANDDDGNGIDDEASLSRDGVPLVGGVEDLQVALLLDGNRDGDEDANEYKGADDALGPYASSYSDHSDLREIRFNLVLRTRASDRNFQDGYMQVTENRVASGGSDGFRRRVLETTVKPRNIGFRGQ